MDHHADQLRGGHSADQGTDAWAKEIFPVAHERLKQAAAALSPGTPAQPFVDALTELAQARAGADMWSAPTRNRSETSGPPPG
ncbi:hypothetical protein [Streptomyces sp. Wb2n-11]|uniref:hypothetical protein n=1 Tax=Streptomyces sp. Wb2n-11 TaxID=1030533 RepID=UPI00159EDAB5|nr:hypothetical protein [Streptomyces sp. Wb2n-11]